MYYRKFLRALITTTLLFSSGCSYYFTPEYQRILREDLRALSSREVTDETSRIIKIIKEEQLTPVKDKW